MSMNIESVLLKAELHQLLDNVTHDVDMTNGENLAQFFTDDCVWKLNTFEEHGHEGVRRFLENRAKHYFAMHKGKLPTQRHINTNLRVSVDGEDAASVKFLSFCVYGAGTDQVPDVFARTTVVDCRAVCRRDRNGQWRVARMEGVMILERNDGPSERYLENMPS